MCPPVFQIVCGERKMKKTLLFRAIALGIDAIIIAGIIIPLLLILFGENSLDYVYLGIFAACVFVVLRDIFGKSIGKYLMGLNIVDIKSNERAKFYQRLLRNITAPITIAEGIILLASKRHSRIGDNIAKTKVVFCEDSCILKNFNTFFNGR